MINTYLKFEAEIPNGSKVVAFTRNYTIFLSLKTNLTLKVKVKVTSFQTSLRYLDKQFKLKAKFQMGQFKVQNNYFLSFKANLALKVKVKVTSFQTHLRHLDS